MSLATPTKRLYAVRLDQDLLRGMKQLKRRVGIPESEQIRRALRNWLTRNGGLKGGSRSRKARREQS